MEFHNRTIDFPATMKLSFAKLMDALKKRMEESMGSEAKYLQSILDQSEKVGVLRKGLNISEIENYRELVDDLMATIFPSALSENEIKCAATPWDFTPFYSSKRLKSFGDDSFEKMGLAKEDFSDEALYISACSAILGMHYRMSIPSSRPFYMKFRHPHTGQVGHYRMTINADFMSVKPTKKAYDITEKDFNELVDNYHNIDLWKEKFPIDSWEISGFMIMNFVDLTMDFNINKLSNNLLNVDSNGLEVLQEDISILLGLKDISVSFAMLEGKQICRGARGLNLVTLMLGDSEQVDSDIILNPFIYEEIIINSRPVAIPNIEAFHTATPSLLTSNLMSAGIESYYLLPIIYNEKKLGFLELGSPKKGALNSTITSQLEQVIPILNIAANRGQEEYKNRVEAVIQEECTTIHPSVKWRFEEEAGKHIFSEDNGGNHRFSDLEFKDVYPLYGQLDISGSSSIRNLSVRNDLVSQLSQVKSILHKAQSINALPIYEELEFVVQSHINLLNTNMDAASEHDIQRFLHNEIAPVFPQISSIHPELNQLVDAYQNSLNTDLHILYNERKEFDESVARLNASLAELLDQKQEQAQSMFPHYFERFKTDGVEFNMYIGHSISPNSNFNFLMFKNLRLWQLMVMVEMEKEYHKLRGTLKKKLNIASLILAHRAPLTIQFRLDEKQFDVDGAYNARYEIIKKRIDKAHIKGTQERITQVGKMVIVYSNDEDEAEYLRYITFLQNKGYFEKDEAEILTIEDLQGVSGLKAIRVGINLDNSVTETKYSVEEIMAQIENN